MQNYPLTKQQLQIAAIEQYIGGAAANIVSTVYLNCEYDYEQLNSVMNEILFLNDSLRIHIDDWKSGKQYIEKYAFVETKVMKFASYNDYKLFASQYAVKLMKNELFQWKIIILPDEYGILIKAHHSICDAVSLSVLAEQFSQLLIGKKPKIHLYADYIVSENNYLLSEKYTQDLTYFRNKVTQLKQETLLKPGITSDFSSKQVIYQLESDLSERIDLYIKKNDITPAAFYMTVIGIYLYRMLGRPEVICIGTTVDGRIGQDERDTVGMFVNNIPVFLDYEESQSFRDALFDVTEESCYESFRHWQVNYLDILKNIDNHPLYDILFNYHIEQIPYEFVKRIEQHYICVQPESLQIHIDDRMQTGQAFIRYEYQTSKFTSTEINIMHYCLMSLIDSVLKNDTQTLIDLHMGNNSVVVGNKCDLPEETIYHKFEKYSMLNAQLPCIYGWNFSLKRKEFLDYVCKLDYEIRKISKGENLVVAVISERSIAMYVAIYAILRAGCVFLPIDPDSPIERIRFQIKDSEAVMVLAQKKYCHLTESIAIEPIMNREYSCYPNKPLTAINRVAYLYYTSGSTGQPKGTKINHKSLINRLNWMQKSYKMTNSSVILQKTTYTFDVALWEILWWGAYGGSMSVIQPGEHFNPVRIIEGIYKYKVTHIHFVPTVFERFVTYLEEHTECLPNLITLRHLFLSGEQAIAKPINHLQIMLPNLQIHNLYGPTECAIDVTWYDCQYDEIDPLPIGKPIYNTSIYVVDSENRIVPQGVQGEILIGGVNVGLGYIKNRELTAEKFIKNPFGEGMVYRTGDYGFLRYDGQLIYCGRKDSQVKLNGQRIELSEIEQVIARHPDVDAVAVVIKDCHICAYYEGKIMSPNALQTYCLKMLPRYMIPSVWYCVTALSTSANGKIDRKKLIELQCEACKNHIEKTEPNSEIECKIIKQYSKYLKSQDIDVNTNFILNGGNSLDVISLLSDLNFENVYPEEFLLNPTPAGLAALAEKKYKVNKILKPLIEPENIKQAVVLLPYAGGSASAYTSILAYFSKNTDFLAVYFADYPHDEREYYLIAEAIAQLPFPIRIYSHCIGAMPALRIISILENEEKSNIVHSVFGAFIPGKFTFGTNPWRKIPKAVLTKVLAKAGAPIKSLNKLMRNDFIERYLADTDFYYSSLKKCMQKKIKCPSTIVISKNDFFTGNYKKADKYWKNHCENLEIVFVGEKTHYFQSEIPQKIAQIILQESEE